MGGSCRGAGAGSRGESGDANREGAAGLPRLPAIGFDARVGAPPCRTARPRDVPSSPRTGVLPVDADHSRAGARAARRRREPACGLWDRRRRRAVHCQGSRRRLGRSGRAVRTARASCDQRCPAPDRREGRPMTGVNINRAAELLYEAHEARAPISPITERYPGMDLAAAYAVQQVNLDRRLTAGAVLIGHKIGLTSKPMQDLLGVDEPDYGYILYDMVRP